jgi:hypothetical protein
MENTQVWAGAYVSNEPVLLQLSMKVGDMKL